LISVPYNRNCLSSCHYRPLSADRASVPPNCSFEVDDLEKEWTWTKQFDFIHCRMMLGSFGDYAAIVQAAYNHLAPGGYLEIAEFCYPALCDDGTLKQDSVLSKWCDLCVEACEKQGRPLYSASAYRQFMADAGFEGLVEETRRWPTNRWPKDRLYKELGTWCLANLDGGLEGITMAHFTRGLGWRAEDVIAFCAMVRKEMRDPKIHAYWPM
jgi:hypothetical protein